MIPANDKIIVSVDYSQKESTEIFGSTILLAKEFSENRRESMPVMCTTMFPHQTIPCGTHLLVHHNRFDIHSPHHLGGNQYSLAINDAIFASVDEDGNAHQMGGNIIVEYFFDNKSELLPDHLKKPNKYKYKVVNNGYGFKKGQYIFCYEFSNYEIIYNFKGIERRIIKVKQSDIVGKITNN